MTAYDQHAIEAFEVNAVDYLLKPVDPARLEMALQRARASLSLDRRRAPDNDQLERIVQLVTERQRRRERLAIKVGERFLLVKAEEIVYASVVDDSITVVADQHAGTSSDRAIGHSTICRRGSTRRSSGACIARIW